jgi:hypothetical protein
MYLKSTTAEEVKHERGTAWRGGGRVAVVIHGYGDAN